MSASCVYDVFLSYTRSDTRNTFASHLLAALNRRDIYTFRDENELIVGKEIMLKLMKGIEQSRISIILFSRKYASSTWCLEELVKIMDCKRTLNQIVIPIFYGVEPSKVQRQEGCYAESFAKHEKRFDLESVKNWRSVLFETSTFPGFQIAGDRPESEYIEMVVLKVASSLEHLRALNWNAASSRSRTVRNIKSWQKGDFLGSGSFGTVYQGFTEDGFFFAAKEVSLLDQGSRGKQSICQLEQEISLLSQFEHENIVQYFGTDEKDGKLYIFLELVAEGSLAKLYQKYQLGDSQVSVYTWQILNGLNYLHSQNVVHRDIKCANILVDVNGYVKLADFGMAKATKFNDIKSCRGTPFWMAPEVINPKKENHGYGLAADIWSLGCSVLEMLTGQVPYSHLKLEWMAAMFRIGRGELPLIPDSLSRDARGFILKCLQVNPDDRPTAAQLLNHPFVKRQLTASVGPAYYDGILS